MAEFREWGFEARDRRKKESVELASKLFDMGIQDPSTINRTVEQYIRTGEFKIPTVQEERVTTSEGVGAQVGPTYHSILPDTEVTVKPTTLGKRVGVFDENTMSGMEVPELQGIGQLTTIPKERAGKTGGFTVFVDKSTGEEIRREPRNDGRMVYQTIGSAAGSGSGPRDPRETAWLDAIKQYHSAARSVDSRGNPKPITPEIEDAAIAASDNLGLDWKVVTEKVKKPGFLGWIGQTEESRRIDYAGGRETKPTPQPGSDMVSIETSDGQTLRIPLKNLAAAKKRDPGLKVR